MDKYQEDRNKQFESWYLRGPGFCGTCGEGLGTTSKEQIELFGRCPFRGEHPKEKKGSK